MAWDVSTARVRAGLQANDASRDADLEAMMAAALASVETYVDRDLLLDEAHERFVDDAGARRLLVRRYPIAGVYEVSADGRSPTDLEFDVQYRVGEIVFVSPVYAREISVRYRGGYAKLPADLEWCLWTLFMALWNEWFVAPATGGGGGGGSSTTNPGTIVQGTGAIKTLTLFNVGSVTYDVGAHVVGGGGTTTTTDDANTTIPQNLLLNPDRRMATILDRYRRIAA